MKQVNFNDVWVKLYQVCAIVSNKKLPCPWKSNSTAQTIFHCKLYGLWVCTDACVMLCNCLRAHSAVSHFVDSDHQITTPIGTFIKITFFSHKFIVWYLLSVILKFVYNYKVRNIYYTLIMKLNLLKTSLLIKYKIFILY